MKMIGAASAERSTQIADATMPVWLLSPCQTPPVGRRSRRLFITSCLYSSKPSCASAATTSRGSAAHASSFSDQCILPCSSNSSRRSSRAMSPSPALRLPHPSVTALRSFDDGRVTSTARDSQEQPACQEVEVKAHPSERGKCPVTKALGRPLPRRPRRSSGGEDQSATHAGARLGEAQGVREVSRVGPKRAV